MASWDDGYVTDVVYTNSFYRETTPTWLAMSALLLGHRPPDLSKPFRYADLGCAHGITALTVAATCPQAEVWGFDFNPAHVESARDIASRAGLTNVRFEEASFAQIAAMAEDALPSFDFIVTHGVLSWISPENQALLTGIIGQRLRPGGLAYVSYNVATGWNGMVPLRALMRMLAVNSPERTDQAVPGILAFLDRMKEGGAAFFQGNPALENRMNSIRQQDARYIAHEYLNKDWHPVMFADVADAMAESKCTYIGSASLTENIDAICVPSGVVPLLAEVKDQRTRETLRDFGAAQSFRRDIYRRGITNLPMSEHHRLLDDVVLEWTGLAAPGDIVIATPIGSLTGHPDVYRPLLNALEAGPLSIRQARMLPHFVARPVVELLQAVALLLAGGFAHPVLPSGTTQGARDSAARLNRVIAEVNARGGDMGRLVMPTIGSSLNADVLETLAVGELLAGRPAELAPLTATVTDLLQRGGRTVQRDGKPVTDPGETRDIVTSLVRQILDVRVPLLRRLGVLAG